MTKANKGLRSHSGIQYSEDLLWGWGTPIYVLDRHEPPDRVWFHPGGGGGGVGEVVLYMAYTGMCC